MYLRLIDREIIASRWPWQGYGWGPTSSKVTAPLAGGARFGAGWGWKLGISVGTNWPPTIFLDLIFGCIRIRKPSRCKACGNPLLSGQQRGGSIIRDGYDHHEGCWKAREREQDPFKMLDPDSPALRSALERDEVPF